MLRQACGDVHTIITVFSMHILMYADGFNIKSGAELLHLI